MSGLGLAWSRVLLDGVSYVVIVDVIPWWLL